MKRSVRCVAGILVLLLGVSAAQAKLQLVENFDSLTGTPDGQLCTGVLGGFIDTQSENTGNSALGIIDGSNAMNIIGHSSGNNARGIGVGGINNPIENYETGIAFARVMIRNASPTPRSYIGLLADATDNPITNTNSDTPTNIPLGFGLLGDGSGGLNVTQIDGSTILKAGLKRAQWYNVWIVADNVTDTFDLYMSEATGPAGEPTLPNPEDLIASDLPFSMPVTDPLNGMIFANPAGVGQAERIYIDEIWWDGDQGLEAPTKARNPLPATGATDVPRDGILSWASSPDAVAHDVYFGTSSDAVSNADVTSPLLVSRGQATNTYNPGRLELGQTYYWRVDEVNAPPSSTVFKGDVWSFTVEPVAYAIPGAAITATASSSWGTSSGPQKTVDGSGLNGGDLHSTAGQDMWLSDLAGPQPTWIAYQFDKVYKLREMWVWNQNQSIELAIGYGFKDVSIEYSLDGITYTPLGAATQFAQAPGTPDYAHNTTVDFGGISAKYVRLTASSNWGGILAQYGLSEVRFLYVPMQARGPNPSIASGDVAINATLGWRAGREAGEHKVYLSTDEQAVIDGTAPVTTVAAAAYGPLSLDLDRTYYWRVDEVNGVDTWPGDVWNFKTQGYLTVDDFESYNDIEAGKPGSNLVYLTWIDGFDNPSANGSTMGYVLGNPQETRIVHGGKQSVPLMYNNTVAAISEVTVNTGKLATGPNWSKGGAQRLSLWLYGDPNNAPQQMYVKVNNAKATYTGNLTTAQWQEWVIDLTALGVNLSNVTTLTIGFERAGAAGGIGTVLIDEIRLYPALPPVVADFERDSLTRSELWAGDARLCCRPVVYSTL